MTLAVKTPKNRTRSNTKCHMLRRGSLPITVTHPEIAAEWDTEANERDISTVSKGVSDKVWWICSTHSTHKWEAQVCTRTGQNTGCPTCSGQQVEVGFNDLASQRPEIAAEWHPTKNGNLNPTDVTYGTSKLVWWVCSIHPTHEWETQVCSRTGGNYGCPTCSGKQVEVGFNDLASKRPEIAAEWHPTKNGNLNPTDVTCGVRRVVWWVCSIHPTHEWEAEVKSRTGQNRGTGCPTCSGKQVEVGFNDLASQRPEIAADWHPTKNGELNPTDVTCGVRRVVWWICSIHPTHEWEAQVCSRAIRGTGCPTCSGSRIERMVFEVIRRMGINALRQHKITDTNYDRASIEVDILLPESKIVIEYDGVRWHSLSHKDGETARRDHLKTLALLAQGYKVIRIRDFMARGERLHLLDIDSDALIQLTYQHSLKQEDVDALVARILEAVNTLDKKGN